MSRHPQILRRNQTALLIVDLQQKINAVMQTGDLVVESVVKLIKGCQHLQVPIFATEQYPKGLGPTEPAVSAALENVEPIQKMAFSCCDSEPFNAALQNSGVKQVVVTGIECHVCVLQTALDLLSRGFQVHVPRDAVSSRKALDYETGLERMARAGVVLTTVESVLFELLERSDTPEFKPVTSLIK